MPTATDRKQPAQVGRAGAHPFVHAVHGVRYQVTDVARAVAFYTTRLGFALEQRALAAFASVSLGDTRLLLSSPQASGSRPMPNGQPQAPGGWNLVVLRVHDLSEFVEALKKAGVPFRNHVETGPGAGRSSSRTHGNPIELFEPAR